MVLENRQIVEPVLPHSSGNKQSLGSLMGTQVFFFIRKQKISKDPQPISVRLDTG